jgi:hypothetical protein
MVNKISYNRIDLTFFGGEKVKMMYILKFTIVQGILRLCMYVKHIDPVNQAYEHPSIKR